VRKGTVLLHVLVMTTLLMLICAALVGHSLQSRTLGHKAVAGEEASAEMESAAAKVWGCLNDAGYPAAGSCAPSAQQRACVPAGTNLQFTGAYPACRLVVNLEKN
jgi:hypothetical protein